MEYQEYKRASDRRIDHMEKLLIKIDERLDEMEKRDVKLYTIVVGNGVPGLVKQHENLVIQQREDKSKIHDRIDKIDNSVKKIFYAVGGVSIIVGAAGVYSALQGLGVL